MSPPDLVELRAFAESLADRSRPIAQRLFRTELDIDEKADLTPVTQADREIERTLRAAIQATYPQHGVLGEEEGPDRIDAEFVWVLDPIDGTKAFATGKPLFGTLIGLMHKGRPVVGVMDTPATGERWSGAQGQPSTHDGRIIRTRDSRPLERCVLYSTSPDMFGDDSSARFDDLKRSVQWCQWGADCYAYGMLADGSIDLVVERLLGTHDWCALAPIVRGAGGVFSDFEGGDLTFDSAGEVLVASSPEVADAALPFLRAP